MRTQTGHIFKRYGHWYLRYADSIMENGAIVRKQIAVKLAPVSEEYRTKRDVRSLAAKKLAPINAGEVDPQSTMRVEEFIRTVYLPDVKETKRRSTYKNYSDIFKVHVQPRLGRLTLRKFRCVDAEKLLADIVRHARTKDGQPLSHSSVERIKAFLSGTFKCAKRKGAYDGMNPVTDSSIPQGTAPPRETHAYGYDEIRKILNVLDEPARTVVLLFAHTGMRKGEAEGLLWRDYDGRSLSIERSLWNGFVNKPKTSASEARIPVTPQLRSALEAHRLRMGDWSRDGFPIFQSEVHTPMNTANLVKRIVVPALAFARVADKTIPRWHGWHAFRRGLATNLHAAGVDDKTIQSILRHSNVRITQDIYIKTIPESRVNAMNLVGPHMELADHAPSVHRPGTDLVN
jgi:integrase